MNHTLPLSDAALPAVRMPADWRDFLALTKPRVMSLVVFTGLAGLFAAPGHINPVIGLTAILCIALAAGACGALNQWYEVDIDARMRRTVRRPLPAGRMDPTDALHFGVALAVLSVLIMGLAVNLLAAVILTLSILFYVIVYTVWLKRRTPQNIVIGGAAGAFPFLIGWVAVTGQLAALPVLMFLIVFLWTPPHFWSLALFVETDYCAAGVPMLPVVAGAHTTRRQIAAYAMVMGLVAVLPWAMGVVGWIYGVPATALTIGFVALSGWVGFSRTVDAAAMRAERLLFKYSILYLFAITALAAADRLVLS